MNTLTPITDAHKRLWTKLYNLAHDEIFDPSDGAAHKLIADSEAKAVAALTTERDELRAENATLRAAQKACEACDEPTAFEVRQLRARAEKAEANETIALANWNGALERAIKAEADLVALAQCHDDNCRALVRLADELTKERARLDAGTILLTVAGERVWHSGVDLRAAIDAALKEGAK